MPSTTTRQPLTQVADAMRALLACPSVQAAYLAHDDGCIIAATGHGSPRVETHVRAALQLLAEPSARDAGQLVLRSRPGHLVAHRLPHRLNLVVLTRGDNSLGQCLQCVYDVSCTVANLIDATASNLTATGCPP